MSKTKNLWHDLFLDAGQTQMIRVRKIMRKMGVEISILNGGEPDPDLISIAAVNFGIEHQSQDAVDEWIAFRGAFERAGYRLAHNPPKTQEDTTEDTPAQREISFQLAPMGRDTRKLLWMSQDGGVAHPPQMAGDVGIDLETTTNVDCYPGQITYLPLGVSFAAPHGTWIWLTGRSSTARKMGLVFVQGVIDEGYRGEMFAGVTPVGDETVTVYRGTRIAQAVLMPAIVPNLEEVSKLPESERGTNGFGSTGGH
jgi:dUTP pyrophosphatase